MKSIKKIASLFAALVMTASAASISCSAETIGGTRDKTWLRTTSGGEDISLYSDVLIYKPVASNYFGGVFASYNPSLGVKSTSKKYSNNVKKHFARVKSGGKTKETWNTTFIATETSCIPLKNNSATFQGVFTMK